MLQRGSRLKKLSVDSQRIEPIQNHKELALALNRFFNLQSTDK